MSTTNPITGDLIKSRSPSSAYSEGYDRIFGKKEKQDSKQETPEQPKQTDQEKTVFPGYY